MTHQTFQRRAEDLANNWHLDKRIPLALIFTALAQIGTFIWWAAKTDEGVTALNNRVALLEASELSRSAIIERVIRVEEKISNINSTMQRVEKNIESLVEQRRSK